LFYLRGACGLDRGDDDEVVVDADLAQRREHVVDGLGRERKRDQIAV